MEMINKRGYLKEDFRLFHIRDQVELELGYHYHEFDKIVVFLTGNVTYVVEGKAYFLKPWDILLVPHNQIHRPIIDPSEPYERIILWVNADYLRDHCLGGDDLRQCFTMAEEKSFSLIRPENADRVTLMKQLNTVESAMGAQEFGHELPPPAGVKCRKVTGSRGAARRFESALQICSAYLQQHRNRAILLPMKPTEGARAGKGKIHGYLIRR